MSGKGINQSGIAAGFGDQTGYALMKNPAIRSALATKMEQVGITDIFMAKKVKQGLNAKTVPRRDGGKRYDDQFVRKQWADIVFKLRGDYAPEKLETEHKIIQLVIDGNMLKALQDSKVITDKDLLELNHEPILDAEVIEECGEERILDVNGGEGDQSEDQGTEEANLQAGREDIPSADRPLGEAVET